jgi:S1-C subfamily serine protease
MSLKIKQSVGCVLMVLALTCGADELADKGRAIFKSNHFAVVTVQLVVKSKMSMGGRSGEANEARQDVAGTVVDSSGLTVLSLSATDPSQLFQTDSGDEGSRFKLETELSDIKMLLEDGTEVQAEVVLRDRDLDLAFIRPKSKPSTPLPFVDLMKSGKAEILDQVISLNRLGRVSGRSYSASVERISAIAQRPRLFYIPDSSMTTTALGAPAFTLEGKVLGIFVMRFSKVRSGGGMANIQADNFTTIIVPAEDVLKGVKQVPPFAQESKP